MTPALDSHPLTVQLKSNGEWHFDTFWRLDEITKARARVQWHRDENFPIGGEDVRLCKFSMEIIPQFPKEGDLPTPADIKGIFKPYCIMEPIK